jgi:hypothetical protein
MKMMPEVCEKPAMLQRFRSSSVEKDIVGARLHASDRANYPQTVIQTVIGRG